MKYRIIIPVALLAFAFAAPAFASEVSGTITAGTPGSSSGSSGQIAGTVATPGESGSSGTVGGTVASSGSSGSGGSGGSSGSGGGGGSIAFGSGGANPLPGSTSSTVTTTTTSGSPTETITTTSPRTFFSPNIPASEGGAALTSGNSLADNAGTTSPEVFGTDQLAAASASGGYLWWVVAIAGLVIIGLAWLGYRELA